MNATMTFRFKSAAAAKRFTFACDLFYDVECDRWVKVIVCNESDVAKARAAAKAENAVEET